MDDLAWAAGVLDAKLRVDLGARQLPRLRVRRLSKHIWARLIKVTETAITPGGRILPLPGNRLREAAEGMTEPMRLRLLAALELLFLRREEREGRKVPGLGVRVRALEEALGRK